MTVEIEVMMDVILEFINPLSPMGLSMYLAINLMALVM
jgi:hypothetical protein